MTLHQTPLFGFNRSGGSYLTNVLLELGVCVSTADFDACWEVQPAGRYRLKAEYREYLGGFYPRFLEQDVFEFPSGVGVQYTHEPPASHELEGRALHLVRDPRGMALSVFDRHVDGRTLEDFLGSNCNRDGPRPRPFNLFGLYPTECWALFSSAIEAAYRGEKGNESLLTVHFEQLKKSSIEGLRPVLKHLGLTATDDDIRQAVERSSKEAMDRAEIAWRAMHPGVDPDGIMGVRRSKTGGWRAQFGPAETRALGAITHEVMAEFGYGSTEMSLAPLETGGAGVTPREVLAQAVQALRDRTGCVASRLELGLRIRACDQILRMFRGHSESAAARRALARILGLYGLSEGRALHWLSAYQGLKAVGDSEGARFALEVGVARSGTSGEHMESALQLSLYGDRQAALEVVERAVDLFGRDLIEAWDRRVQRRASSGQDHSPAFGLLERLGWPASRPTHPAQGRRLSQQEVGAGRA